MKRRMLPLLAAIGAVIAVLMATLISPATAANSGDIWLTNSPASGAGSAHEPHLGDTTVYLHGSGLVASSGTFDIASIPGTGSGKTIWSGKLWASSNGTDVIAQFSGSDLVAAAIADDNAVANPNQGYHFKITLYQGDASPSVATAQSDSNDTKTKTFWVTGPNQSPTPSLTITKTADAASVVSGGNVGFTITAAAGPGSFADDVAISDPLPSGDGIDWTISPAYTGQGSCSIQGTAPAQTLSCHIGDLSSGDSVSVHVQSATAAGTTAALAPLTLTNTACGSFESGADACATATTTVDPAAPSLTIHKTADAATVPAGSSVGFTIAVGNTGPGVALGTTLSDPLPATGAGAWAISPAYSGGGSCSISGSAPSQALSCTLGNLAAGATDTIHVTALTPGGSAISLTNVATASATNNDPVTATATTGTTLANPTTPLPKLAITKVADSVTVTAGDPAGFTITVGNDGTGTAAGATLTDPLPSFTGASWSISPAYAGPGACSVGGTAPNQTLSCSFGDLAPGASELVHVTTSTPATPALTITNTATAQATDVDPVTATATTRSVLTSVLGTSVSQSPSPSATDGTHVLGLQINRPQAPTLPFTGGPAVFLYFLAAGLLLAGGVVLVVERLHRKPAPAAAGSRRPPWTP